MTEAGYSGTPLIKKLGLKSVHQVLTLDLPTELEFLLSDHDFPRVDRHWPEVVSRRFDCILWFGTERRALEADATQLFSSIKWDGFLWIAWPKKASKVPTTLTEDVLRETLLPTGLVDVKVCAINETWSGLKFVIRKEHRASAQI